MSSFVSATKLCRFDDNAEDEDEEDEVEEEMEDAVVLGWWVSNPAVALSLEDDDDEVEGVEDEDEEDEVEDDASVGFDVLLLLLPGPVNKPAAVPSDDDDDVDDDDDDSSGVELVVEDEEEEELEEGGSNEPCTYKFFAKYARPIPAPIAAVVVSNEDTQLARRGP